MTAKLKLYSIITFLIFITGCSNPVITGIVTDYFGRPLEGVKIQMKNSNLSSITNEQGKYNLTYLPGEFTIVYSKDGYSSHEMSLNLSSKEKYPAQDIVLIQLPAKEGVYFYDANTLTELKQNKISIAGTFLESISGIKHLTENITDKENPTLLIYGNSFPSEHTSLHKLIFTDSANIQNIMGKSSREIRLWTAIEEVPFKITQYSAESHLGVLEITPSLTESPYAISWGGLQSKNPLDSSVSNNIVFDFQVINPLLKATIEGNIDKINDLLSKGANIEARDRYGATPIMLAVQHHHLNAAKTLLSQGANVNAKDSVLGWTPILIAAKDGRYDFATLFINNGADVHAEGGFIGGWKPIHYAADGGYIEILQLLLDNGVDVNEKSKSGDTALMSASQRGKISAVKILIENGADVNAVTNQGGSALSWGRNNADVVKLLKEAGAKE